MDEQEILDGLEELGIQPVRWRLVLLLPLVQVAWADGVVQIPERTRILQIARRVCAGDARAERIVEGWLHQRPSAGHLGLGRRLLVALAHRQRGLGSAMDSTELDRVVDLCVDVASAAGGLFDIAFTVSADERAAIAEITAELTRGSEAWRDALPGDGTLTDL